MTRPSDNWSPAPLRDTKLRQVPISASAAGRALSEHRRAQLAQRKWEKTRQLELEIQRRQLL